MDPKANPPNEDQVDDLVDQLAEFDDSLHDEEASSEPHGQHNLAQLQSTILRLERHWPRTSKISQQPSASTVDTSQLDAKIGRFEIQSEIGRGGFGVVFLARDPQLDRLVALKVPRPDALVEEDLQRRFASEAAMAASLDHASIVPIYEANPTGLTPYIASAYCPGPDLSRWLQSRETPVAPKQAAAFIADLASAVQYAHEQGVLHRDLKPSNVLLEPRIADSEGEQLSDYEPRLTDFGLAKLLEGSLLETQSSLLVGTPLYMAPEQLANNSDGPTEMTDVYALGVLLFELLTLQTPFDGDSYVEVLDKIRGVEVGPIRKLNSEVPADLETICHKCLEKEPSDRYQTAAELSEDLGRFLSGKSILARPIGRTTQLFRWCKRRPRQAILATLLIASIAIGIFASGHFATNEKLAQAEAQAERDLASWNAYRASLIQMNVALNKKDYGQLERMLDEAKPLPSQPDFRGWEWSYLQDRVEQEYFSCDGLRAAWHPARLELAVVVGSKRKWRIELWDLDTKVKTKEILLPVESDPSRTARPVGVKWSNGGARVTCATRDGRVCIFDYESGTLLFDYETGVRNMWSFDMARSGRLFATSDKSSNRIEIWDAETGDRKGVLQDAVGYGGLRSIAFNRTGSQLVAMIGDGSRATWNVESGLKTTYRRLSGENGIAAWNPSGSHFAITDLDEVSVYELGNSEPTCRLAHPLVECVCWVDDSRLLAAGGDHASVLWDTEDSTMQNRKLLQTGLIYSLAVSSDGEYSASLADGNVVVSAIDEHSNQATLLKPTVSEVSTRDPFARYKNGDLSWSESGTYLVSALPEKGRRPSPPRQLRIWDTQDFKLIKQWPVERTGPLTLNWQTQSQGHLGASRNLFWRDVDLGADIRETIRYCPQHHDKASCSSDGRWLAYGSRGSVSCVDTHNGDMVRGTLHGYPEFLCWGNGNRKVALATADKVVIWNPSMGKALQSVFRGDWLWGIGDMKWSPTNRWIAVGDYGGEIRLFSTEKLVQVGSLEGHSGRVSRIDWNPNDSRLASAGGDGTVRIWNAATGDQLLTLEHPNDFPFISVAWSRDGRRLAAGDSVGSVFIWGSRNIKPLQNTIGLASGVIEQTRHKQVN